MASQFGMIGLAVMGRNLALNVEDHGFSVAVWNREQQTTIDFCEQNKDRKFTPASTLEEFVAALERPRRIMMMIKAGAPVDEMLDRLTPLLEPGDVVIDGGNSWFKDTQARTKRMEGAGIHFVGSGVSGGEDGARFGPSMMPGGSLESYETIRPVFEAIAAKSDSGPCVTHCGPDGAGHFVKMVHNGIEYGDMQLIAEAYDVMRRGLGLRAEEIAEIFEQWNRGPLESFLIEITAKIFRHQDAQSGGPLVDRILDKAGQKGTGKWTAIVALNLAVPIPTIAAAIDARVLSSMKSERVVASKVLPAPDTLLISDDDRRMLIGEIHDALYASKICSYAQGFALIQAGAREWNWPADLREIARIWKAGCIIRARFLDSIMRAYERNPSLTNLLLDDTFRTEIGATQNGWRSALSLAQFRGIPTPAMSASLAYYDAMRSEQLPQNLTQAQRDFFGAHTYQRNDQGENAPFVHSDWS